MPKLSGAIKYFKTKKRVYALFIDFAQCFPSINHKLLWDKLFKKGVSAKIIRILKSLYESLEVRVKTIHGLTESFQIPAGLAQGEILSPLTFNI